MVTGKGIFTSGSLLPTHHDRDIKFLSAGRRKCEMSGHSRASALGRLLASRRRNAGVLERRWTGTEVSDSGGMVQVLARGLWLGMGSGQGEWDHRARKRSKGRGQGGLDSCTLLWFF